jgi:hypothetical protein
MTTVLLIEPNAADARSYSQWLERAGFRVTTNNEDFPPDVIVISVSTLEEVRTATHDGRLLPKIILWSEAVDRKLASAVGCAVLIRPVMYDDLVTTVRRLLKQSSAASAPVVEAHGLGIGSAEEQRLFRR